MKKKHKKFNVLRFITFIILLIITYFIISYLFNIKTKNIIIIGNEYYNDETIIETANIENYPNFITLNKSKIKRKLNNLELIEEVQINKKYNFTIEINIKEKDILYLVRSTNKYKLSTKEDISLDNISGIPTLINYVPEEKKEKLIERFTKINKNIRNKISEIEYNKISYDDERFLLYMNDGNEVYITLSKIDSLNKYNEIVKKLEEKKGILYLDSGNYFEIKEK